MVPSAATAIIELANTLDVETGTDELATPADLATWLRGRGMVARHTVLTETDRHDVVTLRQHLITCLLAHHDAADENDALAGIEAITRHHPLQLTFEHGTSRLVGTTTAVGPLVATIADAIITLQREGHWQRVRACPAADCLEAFYDESRGGTRRWCSMEACGNRAKVTTYRHRKPPR